MYFTASVVHRSLIPFWILLLWKIFLVWFTIVFELVVIYGWSLWSNFKYILDLFVTVIFRLCNFRSVVVDSNSLIWRACHFRVTYYAEFSPTKHRGKAIVLIEVFFALGGSLAALLTLLTLEPYGWRVWLIACALPSITFVIFVYVSIQTPKYPFLCLHADSQNTARKCLFFP